MDDIDNSPEPANLRFLRRLVTVLTATMIVGLIAIFLTLVMRLRTADAVFPEMEALPAGVKVISVSRTPTEIIVVGEDRQLYVISKDGTHLRQTIVLQSDN